MEGSPILECPVVLDFATVGIAPVARVGKSIHLFEVFISPFVPRTVGVVVERTRTSQVVLEKIGGMAIFFDIYSNQDGVGCCYGIATFVFATTIH